jgi:hypothetical protein
MTHLSDSEGPSRYAQDALAQPVALAQARETIVDRHDVDLER